MKQMPTTTTTRRAETRTSIETPPLANLSTKSREAGLPAILNSTFTYTHITDSQLMESQDVTVSGDSKAEFQ